ncbi:MAG: NAD(P)-binding domain-containing protein [Lachnospiraceae bacterium]|nr:NAD(P)-binding domain-containing protein [Lachnospiraceae bacterium]
MRTHKTYQLGLLGAGRMGRAIGRGAVIKELERWQVCAYDPRPEVHEKCKREGWKICESEQDVAHNAHLLLLAVSPEDAGDVLEKIKEEKPECILSIVTGLSTEEIKSRVGEDVPVIRAITNSSLPLREGSTALCRSADCPADEYDFAFQLFNSMGVARTIPEELLEYTVAVHSSIPAYVYYFTDCLLKDAVSRGFDEEDARDLLVETIIGAGRMLAKNSSASIEELINQVASIDNTTVDAVNVLKEQKMEEIIHEANSVCVKKAEETAEEIK